MDDSCAVDGTITLSGDGITLTLTLTSNSDGGDCTGVDKTVTDGRGYGCAGVGATSNDGDGGDCAGVGATNGGDASSSSVLLSSLPVSNSIGLLLLDDPDGRLYIPIDKSDSDDK